MDVLYKDLGTVSEQTDKYSLSKCSCNDEMITTK